MVFTIPLTRPSVVLVILLFEVIQGRYGDYSTPPNCFTDQSDVANQYDCATLLNNLENSIESSGDVNYQPTDGNSGGPAGCNQTATYGTCVLSICRTPDTKQDENGYTVVPGPPAIQVPNKVNPNVNSIYTLDIAKYLLSKCAYSDNIGGKITVFTTNLYDGKDNQVDVQLSSKNRDRKRMRQLLNKSSLKLTHRQRDGKKYLYNHRKLDEEYGSPVAYVDNGYYCIKRAENNIFLRRESYYETANDAEMNSADNDQIGAIIDEMNADIHDIVTENAATDYVERSDGNYFGTFSAFNNRPNENQFINLGRIGPGNTNTDYELLLADAEAAIANEIVGLPATNNLRFMAFGVYAAPEDMERPGSRQSTLIGTIIFNRKTI